MNYTVQRWSKYKLSRGGFEHDKEADKTFPTEAEALRYMRMQDWGAEGDTAYDYLLVPLDPTHPNAAGKAEGAEMSSEEFLAMLDATCAKLIERQKMKGWKPIEEAPKDGTRILLLLEGVDCAIGSWNKDAFDGPMWEDDSLEPVPFILTPTHFQPLPEPPTL